MAKRLDPFKASIQRLGLNQASLSYHADLLHTALRQNQRPTFPILDTCRLDNGGVLPEPTFTEAAGKPWASGYVAFVPAAGAASRYSQPLYALSEALEQGDQQAAIDGLKALANEGASAWPLPSQLAELVAQPSKLAHLNSSELKELSEHLQLPKALMPCAREGVSFLAMKHLEHTHFPGLSGQVFVTPPGMQRAFATHLSDELAANHTQATALPTSYLEQGAALSSIRFERSGQPFIEQNGEVSPVPAGHGSLAQLFPEVSALFPASDALFIRNIDNIMGTSPEVLAATQRFLSLHRRILTAVQHIRTALGQADVPRAGAIAAGLAGALDLTKPGVATDSAEALLPAGPEYHLWLLQVRLFHARLDEPLTLDRLEKLYARPVNVLGQVPNTQRDVGGTPCFITMPDTDSDTRRGGPKRGKVCLEVPHATPDDKLAKLANHELATHFNPGFCAVEITSDPQYYSKRNHHFWLMAEKTYRGQAVVYYETVLYELIGHSDFANTVFVEVPRQVFHPHKTLRDALDRTLASWLGA